MLDHNPETARAWRLIFAAAGVDLSHRRDDEVIDHAERTLSATGDIVRALTVAAENAGHALTAMLARIADDGLVDAEVVDEPTHRVYQAFVGGEIVSVCCPEGVDYPAPGYLTHGELQDLLGVRWDAARGGFPPVAKVALNA